MRDSSNRMVVDPSAAHPDLSQTGGVRSFLESEFHRYLLASGVAFGVDFGALYLLTSYAGLHYLQAAAAGFTLGLITVYLLSVTWVFKTRKFSDTRLEFIVFSLVGFGGLLLNELSMYVLTGILGLYYLGAKVLSVFVVFSWNFAVRKLMLFTR